MVLLIYLLCKSKARITSYNVCYTKLLRTSKKLWSSKMIFSDANIAPVASSFSVILASEFTDGEYAKMNKPKSKMVSIIYNTLFINNTLPFLYFILYTNSTMHLAQITTVSGFQDISSWRFNESYNFV